MPDPVDIFDYPVTEYFGDLGPFGGEKHTGVDLGLPRGTPVGALGEGTVRDVFTDAKGGRQVRVTYASGAEGWFAHLKDIFVRAGQKVTPKTVIATSGDTGKVTGPHLHFEERDPQGQLVDPLSDRARTYIGGGTEPNASEEQSCPVGSRWSVTLNKCVPVSLWDMLGLAPNPNADPLTGAPRSAQTGISLPDPLAGVAGAIENARASFETGARQLVVAGFIVGTILALGYAGVKRTLD